MRKLPEYDESITCWACGKDAPVMVGFHGVFGGGGPGRYTCCEACGKVLSKTLDDPVCESHDYAIALQEALEKDGEKLRAETGEDHGPWEVSDATDNKAGQPEDDKRAGGPLPGARE